MSYQKLVTSDDDIWDDEAKASVFRKSNTNSFRKRLKSGIHLSSLNLNYRCSKASHSLPNSPKKSNISFFRINGKCKGDSEEKLLLLREGEDDLVQEMQG